MNEKKEIYMNEIVNSLRELIPVEAIVLFGSYARNKERPDSDIDIAIKPKKQLLKNEFIKIKNILEDKVNKDIHFINLDEINDDFRYDILITGKELYVENETKFMEYKMRAFNKYLQLNEDRQIILEKIRNGGTLYGK